MSYIHLTIEKRSQIEVLRKERYSVRRIELHLQKLCPIFGVQFKKGRGSFIYLYRLNKNNDPSIIGAPI